MAGGERDTSLVKRCTCRIAKVLNKLTFIASFPIKINKNKALILSFLRKSKVPPVNISFLVSYIYVAILIHLHHQHEDGSWGYSIDVRSGKERIQTDFHQGFILCSLGHIKNLLALEDARVDEAIRRGLRYYRGVQFNDQGVSMWRVPKEYPVEIHNQAQGIITFSEFASYGEEYKEFAQRIAEWTIAQMYSKKKGYFYYRMFKHYTIRIPYMRWSQAWMLLALSTV